MPYYNKIEALDGTFESMIAYLYTVQDYQEVINTFDITDKVKVQIIEYFFILKDYQKVISFCDASIKLAPNAANYYYHKGKALCALGQYEEATNAYDKAIRLAPNIENYYHCKANAIDQYYNDQLGLKQTSLTKYYLHLQGRKEEYLDSLYFKYWPDRIEIYLEKLIKMETSLATYYLYLHGKKGEALEKSIKIHTSLANYYLHMHGRKKDSVEKSIEISNNQIKLKENTMKADEQVNKEMIIREIFNLIAEGNARIKEEGGKGILILGKTGTGKSTLTHLLAGQELMAVLDEDTGTMRLEAKTPIENIKINHEAISETKIPSKYKINDTTIWDCPGFKDTGGIEQEIANAFYIQRLVETNKQLKFILTIPDSLLSSKSDLIPIVDHFAKGFTHINSLENSVALIVTKVPGIKTKKHIENSINKITKQNSTTIEPNTLEMFNFLLKSIHIFSSPSSEGVMQNRNIFKEIDNSIKYIDTDKVPNLANIIVSEESTKYAKELLEITYDNIKKLVDIFVAAIEKPTECTNNNSENIFIKSYEFIKPWLPSSLEYAELNRLPQYSCSEHFFKLKQVKAFQKLFETSPNNKNSNFAQDIFFYVLEIFEEFSSDKELKQRLQEYAHIFKQQIEYTKFLSQVCGNTSIDYKYTDEAIEKCKIFIKDAIEQQIKNITIEDDNTDISYYEKAIEYLSQYKDDPTCLKNISNAHYNIGRICDLQKVTNKAIFNYIKALELNKEIPQAYEKIGAIFFNNKQYEMALKYFSVLKDSIKIKSCFKELIKLYPNNPTIRIEQGEYFESIGNFDQARECYQDACSLTKNNQAKTVIATRIITLLSQQTTKYAELAAKIEAEGFYRYDQINIDDLYLASSKLANDNNEEVNNIGTTLNLYG